MTRYVILLVTLLLSVVSFPTLIEAQESAKQVTLKGTVTDQHGETLPGAMIKIKGTPYGTITDSDGAYILRGTFSKGSKIVFSSVGMKTVEVEYFGQETQDAAMQENIEALGELVVTAEGNINNIDIRARSGVVETVDMKRLNEKPMANIGLALQGAVPGLIVTNAGDLGSKPKIRIRGNQSLRGGDAANEPLYVLDGKVISAEAFMTLAPQDIREIKILKDAAACALYGIKAANGVIEISSKRGTKSGGIDITYTMNMGATLKGRRGVTVMNSAEKLEFERLLGNPSAPGYRYSADYYNRYERNNPQLAALIASGEATLDSLRGINTDWFNELMRVAFYQSHNLSLRGGNERTSYFLSGNISTQGGQIKGNSTLRANLRLGIDQQIGNIGYFSFNMDGAYSDTKSPNGSEFSPASLVYNLNPYESISKNKLWSYPNRTFNDILSQYQSFGNDKRGGASGSINLRPFEGFEISAVSGVDYMISESQQFTPASSYSEQQSGFPAAELGKLAKAKNTVLNYTHNIRALYNRLFDERHNLTFSVNHDYYLTNTDNIGFTGYGVGDHPSAALINQSITGSRRPSISSFKEKVVQLGVGAVAGYTLDNIYDFFATYKLDGSSILPSDKRWNSAWATGLGWTPSSYGFLKDNKVLSRLNIKGSYGKTASLAGVSASQTIATFSYLENAYDVMRMLQLLSLYNTGLKPEHTTSIDAGVQLGLFRHFNVDLQWYRHETADALLDVPIAASNGFGMMKRNIGVLRNEGIELSGAYTLMGEEIPDFSLRIGASVAYNRNKVVDLYYADKIYTSDNALIPDFQVGKAYDMLYGLRWGGINAVTGLPVFLGKDNREIEPGTTALTRDDFIEIGHMTPPYTGTVNISVGYKEFELDADFYWVAGGYRQYSYQYVRDRDNANRNGIAGLVEDMWLKRGDTDKKYSSPFYSSAAIETLNYANTHNTGKSDYLRMSMLSLRYRFPERILKKANGKIKYASVALQASNLFTITPYNESDPETGQMGANVQPVITANFSITF